jgi:hypothetical protein
MQCDGAGHRELQFRSLVVRQRGYHQRKRRFHSASFRRRRDGNCSQHAGPDEIGYGIRHGSVAAAVLLHHHFGPGGLHSLQCRHQRNLAVQCNGKGHGKLQFCGYVVR